MEEIVAESELSLDSRRKREKSQQWSHVAAREHVSRIHLDPHAADLTLVCPSRDRVDTVRVHQVHRHHRGHASDQAERVATKHGRDRHQHRLYRQGRQGPGSTRARPLHLAVSHQR